MSTDTQAQPIAPGARGAVLAYVGTVGAVILLMMVMGFIMRLTEGKVVDVSLQHFYQIMTVHGTGMVGIVGLGGAAVMWYFLSQYVRLSTKVFLLDLGLFLTGVVMILGSVAFGGFAGAWTFCTPCPPTPWACGAITRRPSSWVA